MWPFKKQKSTSPVTTKEVVSALKIAEELLCRIITKQNELESYQIVNAVNADRMFKHLYQVMNVSKKYSKAQYMEEKSGKINYRNLENGFKYEFIKTTVLEILKQQDYRKKIDIYKAIQRSVHGFKYQSLQFPLRRMAEEKLIKRVSKGVYRLATKS